MAHSINVKVWKYRFRIPIPALRRGEKKRPNYEQINDEKASSKTYFLKKLKTKCFYFNSRNRLTNTVREYEQTQKRCWTVSAICINVPLTLKSCHGWPDKLWWCYDVMSSRSGVAIGNFSKFCSFSRTAGAFPGHRGPKQNLLALPLPGWIKVTK